MIWRVSLFLFLFGLATEGTAFALSERKLSLEELTRQADLIVEGRVQDIQTQASQNRSSIITLVVLPLKKQWKGSNVPTVTVKLSGGSAGEITQRVVGQPEFSLGEEVILFLKRQADGRYATVGGKQGKFTVKVDPLGGKEMVEDLTGKKQELEGFLGNLKEILRH